MSNQRGAVALSDDEVQTLLGEEIKVQVATIGADGMPHLSTLFYVVIDGKIAFWTYGKSQKIVNLRRDSRVSVLVEGGIDYHELRGVSITGRARLVEDYDEIFALGSKVVTRMAGGVDLGELGDQIVSKQATKRVGVVIEPDHVASWDHRKMQALPGQ
jgi:nitroimidazol reductase NimA-like FMN-containing flavoprotein (pyridoxamine 5'-phosphate oxidase superfamily)